MRLGPNWARNYTTHNRQDQFQKVYNCSRKRSTVKVKSCSGHQVRFLQSGWTILLFFFGKLHEMKIGEPGFL